MNINLSQQRFGNRYLKTLNIAIQRISNLVKIDLSNNNITAKGAKICFENNNNHLPKIINMANNKLK